MRISGFYPNSFVDFEGKIAAVVFLGGCNLDCAYCHNRQLLQKDPPIINVQSVLQRIYENRIFLDGVVITGGEPSLADRAELAEFVQAIKDMNLAVKIDTNGTDADFVRWAIGVADYIAMDVKAPIEKYYLVTPISVAEQRNIKESIALLKDFEASEFRTTLIPELQLEDFLSIAHLLKGCPRYYLQKYNHVEGRTIPPHKTAYLKTVLKEVKQIIPHAKGRGV